MEAINEEVTGGEYNAPRLTLNAFNSYKFETLRETQGRELTIAAWSSTT